MTVNIQKENSGLEVIPTILRMLELFDARGIRYVHWKSNTNIAQALSGVDDFDILIHPEDRVASEQVFSCLKIVRARSRKDAWQKGIYHYIGADTETCKLVHVHAHFALPVGFDYDKNFVLPVVDDYLANRWKAGQVYLPEIEMEYAVLVIRLILKHGLDSFLLKLPHRQLRTFISASSGVIRGGGYAEFMDLAERVNRERLNQVLDSTFNFVGKELFSYCESVVSENGSIWAYFRASRLLKRRLRMIATHGTMMSFVMAAWRINTDRLQSLVRKKARKNLVTGGRIIAFVGGDGAGKSTNVAALGRLLGAQLAVSTIHIGRPKKTIKGFFLSVLALSMRLIGMSRYNLAITYVRLAIDRLAAYKRACRKTAQGEIVLLDRLPLAGITKMDCPRIHDIRIFGMSWLSKFERRQYDGILGVDCLIILKVDPAIALRRRPDDDPTELMARSNEIWMENWIAPLAKVIDTGINDETETRKKILEIVWNDMVARRFAIELVGLSGSGKSTVAREIVKRLPSVRIALPLGKMRLLRMFFSAGSVYSAWLHLINSKNLDVAFSGLVLGALPRMAFLHLNSEVRRYNFVLDQGPVFQYALGLKEQAVSGRLEAQLRESCMKLDHVYRFMVPYDELFRRVHARGITRARASGMKSIESFKEFCVAYDDAFDRALDGTCNVTVIDATQDVSAIADSIIERVLKP